VKHGSRTTAAIKKSQSMSENMNHVIYFFCQPTYCAITQIRDFRWAFLSPMKYNVQLVLLATSSIARHWLNP
jgi:hypothetical protein